MPFEGLRQDVRFALRTFRARAGFAATAVLTLALGMGATTAVFSVVDGVLLKPLPVQDQAQLLVVWTSLPQRGFAHMPFTYEAYAALRGRLRTVSDLAAHPYNGTNRTALQLGDRAVPLAVTPVTGDWFGVLGVRAASGRMLTAGDDRVGASPVIVLADAAARRLFGREAVTGRTLRIDDVTYTVAGIASPGFEYPGGAQAWVAAVPFYLSRLTGAHSLRDADQVDWDIVARVAPGFTVAQARAELAAATQQVDTGLETQQLVRAVPFADVVVGDVRPGLLVLAAAVLLVLLVAGVNVANLLLVRGLTRARELAVRSAMGASRGRLLRQLATEATVLVVAASIAGLCLAYATLHVLLAFAPPELPRLSQIALDGRALGFTAAIALAGAVLFGMLPAVRTARAAQGEALRVRGAGHASDGRGGLLRHTLVAGQIAVTTIILSIAGLLLRSLDRMLHLDAGFDAQSVALVDIAMPPGLHTEAPQFQRAMVRLAEHIAAVPGISSASAVATQPFAVNGGVDAVWYAEGQTRAAASNPYANYEAVDAAYFRTLGLPIVRGRAIRENDRAGSAPVVWVNEAFARLYWPGADAIGRRIKLGMAESTDPWRTVVGVTADARYRDLTEVRPSVYVPYEQGIPVFPGYVALRTAGDPAAFAATLRRTVAQEEPGAALLGITPLPRLLAAPLARPRFQSALSAAFALLGLLLSVVGTYAVLAFSVRQRTREIGIRMALGAQAASVRALVLRQGLAIGGSGVLAGIAGATLLGRLVQPLLYSVTATDPLVLSLTATTLLGASLLATASPARLAMRTDPLRVMRNEQDV